MFGVAAWPAARGFPASRSAPRCALRGWQTNRCCPRCAQADRPSTTACGHRRKAAPVRHWTPHWRRWREAPRWRLRAAGPWRGRHWRAGSGRACRRDCGSHRRSRRVVPPGSASAGPREFRRARVRCRPAPGRRCRSGGCRRCGGDSERISFSINSIARRGIASVMAARISESSERNAVIDCSIPSGRCSASIWLVILSRCRSSEEKSGPAGAAGCIGGAIGMAHGCAWQPLWGRAARRHRPRCGSIEFVLARRDFRDRKIERRRAERGRGAIHLAGRALDHLGLALLVLELGLSRLRVGDLRQPRVEARDRVVQLPGDARFAARDVAAERISRRQIVARHVAARHIAARLGLRDLLDLAGDRIQPLMDIGDVGRLLVRHRRGLIVGAAKIGRGGIAEGGIEPVVHRHAGAARGGLGPLAHGWIDAFNTPRYARIHALVRFRLRRATCAFSLPARPDQETIEFRAGRLPQNSTFSCYGK